MDTFLQSKKVYVIILGVFRVDPKRWIKCLEYVDLQFDFPSIWIILLRETNCTNEEVVVQCQYIELLSFAITVATKDQSFTA
jgi:hypothetical protein